MDRFKQRLKKEKSVTSTPKEKYVFITDVKSIKESLKIKEILRTVKMNSSMRLKAPRGSKIMSNKDFNDEDCFEESAVNQTSNEPLSASNPDVKVLELEKNNESEERDDSSINHSEQDTKAVPAIENENNSEIDSESFTKIEPTETDEVGLDNEVVPDTEVVPDNEVAQDNEVSLDVVSNKLEINEHDTELKNTINTRSIKSEKVWDRKLSLDQSMLSRRQGFSQSELDLHSMGKSPLERKVSFFRKKMDSFVRNTSEMFKRQNSSLQRRGSMSVSLHSLNDPSNIKIHNEVPANNEQEPLSTSRTSLQTDSSIVRSNSSLSMRQSGPSCAASEHDFAGSQPALHAHSGSSSTLEGIHSNSVHSLNEAYLKEAMLNSRAISMNSGLDSPLDQNRRKASRSNRVTWVASEGLTNYFRRLIQDEKSKELQSCRSYQDFSSIPENELYNRQPESRGRKLSYQRAISGDDPALHMRSQDSSIRRKHQISEHNEAAMTSILEDFNRNGVPKLEGFDMASLSEDTFSYLQMALQKTDIESFYDWKSLTPDDESRQTVIKEMIYTEAEYINHLMAIVNVFIGAAHALQDKGYLLNIDTSKIFSNLPDILNANLYFWHFTFLPMMRKAFTNSQPFDAQLMVEGFSLFRDLVIPYEIFLADQTKLLEYSRQKSQKDPEFALYLSWCHARKECNRLQLMDFLVKPMQRLTKYGLLLNRIVHYTRDKNEQLVLESMEQVNTSTLVDINRSVRYRQEMEIITNLQDNLENLDCEIKDTQVESLYNSYGKLNLSAPMLYCIPDFPRTVIHQADVRFRDATKEIDCRVFLLTDMLIFCRKFSRGYPYKLIRPRYMIDKIVQINKSVSRNSSEDSLVFAVLDDLGTAYTSFTISEPSKDPNPHLTLKTLATKLMEARYTYEIVIWLSQHQTRDLSLMDIDLKAEFAHYKKTRSTADEQVIEQDARERVITLLKKNMGAKNDTNIMTTPPFYTLDIMGVSARPPGRNNMPRFVHRTSKAAATSRSNWVTPQRSSTLSLQEPATSGTPVPRPSGSVEYLQPPPIVTGSSPITVKVITEDSEPVAPQEHKEQSPSSSPKASDRVCSANTLQVQDQKDAVATLIHSLPDLTIEPSTPRSTSSPTHPMHMSASSKLYKSHQQLLQRQKLASGQGQQYLSPDNRGSSYPPPSPTRGSLKRGLAFSYSFKNPPLHKMGHVASQSTTQLDPGPSTSQQIERASSPKPSTSLDKSDKKTKLSSSRRKRRDKSEDRHSEPCTSHRDESPDALRRDESPSPSYRDESPGTSYRDESTDLSGIDRSSSLSHRDESPGTSYRGESPAYREYRRSSSGRDKSLDRSQADESPDLKSVEMSFGSSKDKSPDRYKDSSSSDRHKDMSPSPSRGSASPDPAQRKKSFSSKAVSLSPIASTDEIPGLSIGESSRSSLKEDQSQKSANHLKRDKSPSERFTDDSWESDSTERLDKNITILRPTREQTPGPSRRIRSQSPVVLCEMPTFYQGESSSNIIKPSAAPSRILDVPTTSQKQEFSSSSFRQRTRDIRKSFFRRLRKNEEGLNTKIDSFRTTPKSQELESIGKSPTSSSKSKKSETGRRRWFRRF